MAEKYLLKVDNGFIRLYRQDGLPVRTLCSGDQNAVIKGKEVHVDMKDGKVNV